MLQTRLSTHPHISTTLTLTALTITAALTDSPARMCLAGGGRSASDAAARVVPLHGVGQGQGGDAGLAGAYPGPSLDPHCWGGGQMRGRLSSRPTTLSDAGLA
eukprot:6079027-Prymnesium_polylepis.2